jgi:nucleotide-binding universal stress UspA family protein
MGVRALSAGRRPAGTSRSNSPPRSRSRSSSYRHRRPAPKTLNRVLVPLDAEPTTAAALAETLELAGRHQLELVVLHVHDHASLPAFSDQPQHELAAWSEEFLRRHCPNPDLVRLEVRVGAPGQHVLSVAEEIGVVNTLQ